MRCLAFRFQAFGRPVKNSKKFEEGIFSDLRNLKAGNDASLEEPKSPFLDFLYKNNCIRTQKKQKVFYWYSVPHDRLFLDALERDLKREKAGQEATTVATYEPALSFEFDQSQSLFEQLTKTNSAAQHMPAFSTPQEVYSQSASPNLAAAADSMPPPPTSMVSQAMQSMPQDGFNDMTSYSQTQMPVANGITSRDYYDHNPMPSAVTAAQRQGSMPAPYLEYSPAPSFVSSQSQYEDFSNRGVSYEPITPPQQMNTYTPEPVYASNEDNGLYSALSDAQAGYPSAAANFGATPYNSMPKSFPGNTVTPIYSHLEGSPNYKQRRRRSPSATSYTNGASQMNVPSAMPRHPHSVKRPSDLRRSISMSMDPQQFERAASGPPASFNYMQYNSETPNNMSRQGSPMSTIEDQQGMNMLPQQRYGNMMNDGMGDTSGAPSSGVPGAFRRARSATVSDVGPYPQKSHSCPIPSCGRLFKRLEHLKRYELQPRR